MQEYRFPLEAMPMTAIDIDLVSGIRIKVFAGEGWRGHNINNKSLPGSPALCAGSFTIDILRSSGSGSRLGYALMEGSVDFDS